MEEKEIGKVLHFFGKISVAALKITADELKVGDTIHIRGHTSDFNQVIDSMQKDNAEIPVAKPGDDIGIKAKEHAREGDIVYKVLQ